ncbi:MAG: hypothetical protein J5684_06760 [Eubacterium sp.]|nr:hypothetical protein [Eubacterium sp.]
MFKDLVKDKKRILICFAAVFGMGFFVSLLIMCNLGTDPCTFMNQSVSAKVGLSFGNWQLILNIVMFIFVIIFNRKLIGFGTVFNMVLIGYYVDFFTYIWKKYIPETTWTNPVSRWIIFLVVLFCFIVCASVYINSDTGVAPYDALPIIITNFTERVTGKDLKTIIRIVWDGSAILIGTLCGGKPVVGIVLMALFLGPIITAVGKLMNK